MGALDDEGDCAAVASISWPPSLTVITTKFAQADELEKPMSFHNTPTHPGWNTGADAAGLSALASQQGAFEVDAGLDDSQVSQFSMVQYCLSTLEF